MVVLVSSHRPAVKLLLKSIVFSLGLLGILWVTGAVLSPGFGSSNPWPAVAATRNEADVLALGSSHTYCTVLPMELWRDNGVTALDVSGSAQILPVTEEYLAEALKMQHPRVVMLEVYMLGKQYSPAERVRINRAHVSLDCMPLGLPRLKGIVASVGPEHWGELVFPLQAYHSRWANLRGEDFGLQKDHKYSYARGAQYASGTVSAAGPAAYDQVDEVAYTDDLPAIRRIAARCEKDHIQLVLYRTPATRTMRVGKLPVMERLRSDLSSDFPSVRYLDLNLVSDELGLDSMKDYKDDWGHLNYGGAVKVSSWLADYLVREYGLADHRADSLAAKWNADLRIYDSQFQSSGQVPTTDN